MTRLVALVLFALMAAAGTTSHAAEAQDRVQAQDVGLLILAFLILVPLYIAVRIIPGWIESYHNLTDDASEGLSAGSCEAEADA